MLREIGVKMVQLYVTAMSLVHLKVLPERGEALKAPHTELLAALNNPTVRFHHLHPGAVCDHKAKVRALWSGLPDRNHGPMWR